MKSEELNKLEKSIEAEAYRLIRKEANRFNREESNAELGNYVRGIVDLQTEMYKIIEMEGRIRND